MNTMNTNNEKPSYTQLDYGLIGIVIVLAIFSVVAIHYATSARFGNYYVYRQILWYGLGFVAMFATLLIDYRKLKTLNYPLYGLGIILLIIVAIWGEETKGAQRWIEIGGFFNLQPSEIMKIFLVISIAYLMAKTQEMWEEKEHKLLRDDLILTGKVGLITIVPFALILKQPDLGTSLVLIGIVAVMIIVAGVSWRVIFSLALLGAALLTGLVFLYFVNFSIFELFIAPHQLSRIVGWLDPYADSEGFGYQLLLSLTAVGSGKLLGKTIEGSTLTSQWAWVPENHTDFIFSVIGEEFGFIGSSILICFFFILVYRLVQIALTCNDRFGSYLVAGVIGMIIFQVFQNIGMTIGLMPITGLALPFISYGGSALLTNMIAIGIVLNVAMRTKVYMFD